MLSAMVNRTEPKIVLWDLETMPNMVEVMKVMPGLSAYPGLTLKASINSIICFGYKIFGEKETHCINAWDFKSWNKDINDDRELVEKAYDILVSADCVVTHNGKRFDWKFFQTRLLIHGLEPLPKIKHIDTCSAAKTNLLMFNNRLNTVGEFLAKDKKMENGGWELWCKVMQKDPEAMKTMEKYCKQDVILLEKVFKKIRPFVKNIPNYNIWGDGENKLCPSCGSTRLRKMGFATTQTNMFQRWRCNDCGSTAKEPISSKVLRTE